MVRLKYVFVLLILLVFAPLWGDGCQFWFSTSETDSSPVTQLEVSAGDTFTLYAWISADQPSWDWIGAVGFPIVFDTSYLEIITASFNEELGPTYSPDSLYMFAGVDWPGMGQTFADTLESQLLWYISVCFNNCLSCDGTPHYLGSVTFLVRVAPESLTTVVDTSEYPPSNSALVVDNTGWGECAPSWTPFSIQLSGGQVLYMRGDANASGTFNVSDAVYVKNHLSPVPSAPCLRAADADASNTVNISDAVYIVSHLSPSPNFPPPFPDCGYIETDTLPCDSFPPCGSRGIEKNTEPAVAKLIFGEISKVANYYEIPVYTECSEPISAFQFNLKIRGKGYLGVSEEGCETEEFDIFRVSRDADRVLVLGIKSMVPSPNGMELHYLGPGRHLIGILKFASLDCLLEIEDAVFTDLWGMDIIPEIVKLQAEESQKLPKTYVLSQNEPNPFDGSTVIRYALPVNSRVELVIYNATGQRVRTLVRGFQSAGYKSVRWDGRDSAGRRVSPGVYFYKFRAGEFEAIRKLILVK